ncbi:spindle and kinetochore-associated protein 1 [Cololabis saira]|uniref:spindle and kinetochore-associated protein 1 n=1 Tax=Cololabis saira TaxID=129043 RepID=UPI002AD42D4F|nr:spindle and kinetochore-associated protein 1 [Cololabis saira]
MGDLEDISQHVSDKISLVQRMLDLSVIELPQHKVKKLELELFAITKLLEDFEECVNEQKKHLKDLQDIDESYQRSLKTVHHMKGNIPLHIPRKKDLVNGNEATTKQSDAADTQQPQAETVKKTSKTVVKEMEFVTMAEFESIPQYMRGRVSYDQLNAVVKCLNTTVTAKYNILHQSMKTLTNHSRKLQSRFKEQETKDTKGQFFVVDEDIREFTQMKVDKRFQGILNMLRHCQRLRELRGGGLTRYLLL